VLLNSTIAAVTFSPKPAGPEHAGAGFHTNFSTKAMREDGGFEEILRAVDRLAQRHFEHIALYGVGNEDRLTGKDDAPSIETFTFGVATRAAAVRVPRECERRKKGFLEDRRPAANCDPYQVRCARTTCMHCSGESGAVLRRR
jgi:glutamine synthetase